MDKDTRNGLIIFILFCIGFFGIGFGIGRTTATAGRGTGDNTAEQRRINDAIGEEQFVTIGEVRYTREQVIGSIELAEQIRGITAETDSAYAELGLSDRRSSDILEEIKAELQILAGFRNSINSSLDNYNNNMAGN